MHDWPETSESLILRVKDPEDEVAWSQFLAIYRPIVYRLARGRGLQHADAEDLAQKVFVSVARAVQCWQTGEGAPPFRAWLARIARNAIINAVTRQWPDLGTGSTSVQELLDQVPDDENVTAEFLRESRIEAFRWAAGQIADEFNEATWAMFWETAVDGRSVAEVAASHSRSTGAVYMARFRVMQRLKQKVLEVSEIWSA